MIKEMNEEFVVKPDLVFILDIDAKTGLERIQDRIKKDELFEREDYLVNVRKIFKTFDVLDILSGQLYTWDIEVIAGNDTYGFNSAMGYAKIYEEIKMKESSLSMPERLQIELLKNEFKKEEE